VADEELAALLEEVLDSAGDIEPSFFEVTTAAAFLAFSRHPADACVLEVGLGGRLDATNVIESPLVTGIAGLGLDHRQLLGRTLGDIAAEKAGIAKRGSPLVTQAYPPAPAERIRQAAEEAGAPLIARGEAWDCRTLADHNRYRDEAGALDLPLPGLPGRHQADNAAFAVAMIRHQHSLDVPDRAIAEGIIAARWPARLQKLEPGPLTARLPSGSELWVDGGHNGAAARLVAGHVRRSWQGGLPLTILFASLASKDPEAILRPFRGLAERVITLPIEGHEARPPEALAELATRLGFHARACRSIEQALEGIADPSRVLVFGSLYLAGQALAANEEVPD
jgi:dihydrofolate synthase/folylpolyglutamate synthase